MALAEPRLGHRRFGVASVFKLFVKRSLLALLMLPGGFTHHAVAEDAGMENRLSAAFERGELEGLHGVLVHRDGDVFAEVYFPGEDERWGTPLGRRDHGPNNLHDLRSVTKSVVGLLYGIALEAGLVPSVDERLVAQFPEYPDLADDPARREITIRDALTMQMGTEWSEDLPYSDPRNSEIAMELSRDRYRYVLDRPMVHAPGTQWTYNGGATAIIGRLIAKGAGMPLDAYARENLFNPLGITVFEWVAGADGEPSAASGLRMRARDLAKIGQLIVDRGRANGRQVVPSAWLDEALAPWADTGELRYGYFWWLSPDGDPPVWVAGFGNGGQRLSLNPGLGVVAVVFAGNYNEPDAWTLPVKIVTEFVAPALQGR